MRILEKILSWFVGISLTVIMAVTLVLGMITGGILFGVAATHPQGISLTVRGWVEGFAIISAALGWVLFLYAVYKIKVLKKKK